MRLHRVTIKKLFGVFDHEIELNQTSRITILHGLNGVGKTTILRMLDGLFNEGLFVLVVTPFEQLVIDFDDGTRLEVHRTEAAEMWTKMLTSDSWEFEDDAVRSRNALLKLAFFKKETGGQRLEKETVDIFPPSGALNDTLLILAQTREDMSRGAMRRRGAFRGHSPEKWREPWLIDMPSHLEDVAQRRALLRRLRRQIRVQYIHTERLISMSEDEASPRRTVLRYAEELASRIERVLATFAQRAQELDRSFPLRLVQKGNGGSLEATEISKRIEQLEHKRARLVDAGLIGEEEQKEIPRLQVDDANRAVLSVYVEDMEQKFAVFDDLLSRIELFKSLVSERFLHKRVSVDRQYGFRVLLDDGRVLSPSDLSSGEQHELVLLYETIFKVAEDTLVLVDEPELSLHVAWQLRFLEDLESVVALSKFDVLLATHSPQIINDRWDLTVALKGPEAV